MTIQTRIALCSRGYRLSSFINDDIKQIKKINYLLQKLEKTDKDQYKLEILNILRILDNSLDIHKLFIVICELIEPKFHETIGFLISELDNIKISKNAIESFIED